MEAYAANPVTAHHGARSLVKLRENKALQDFIAYVAKQLVDQPDDVNVEEVIGNFTNIYQLKVGRGETGKIIGKHGQTAKSLRTLLTAVSAKYNQRAVLEIIE
jgi:predicted RNA-binding protein YlqC (UPF0109 family)